MKLIKVVALISMLIVLANMLLFAFRVYSATVFWIVIIIMALVAFPGMRLLRKNGR